MRVRVARVYEKPEDACFGDQLAQQLKLLRREPVDQEAHAGDVAPGRARLETIPSLTGSPPIANTIGIVGGSGYSPRRRGCAAVATMTFTGRRTNSPVRLGRRSERPSAKRYSIATFCPSTKPILQARRKAATMCVESPATCRQIPIPRAGRPPRLAASDGTETRRATGTRAARRGSCHHHRASPSTLATRVTLSSLRNLICRLATRPERNTRAAVCREPALRLPGAPKSGSRAAGQAPQSREAYTRPVFDCRLGHAAVLRTSNVALSGRVRASRAPGPS